MFNKIQKKGENIIYSENKSAFVFENMSRDCLRQYC